jgi:hypothetical protein
MQTAKLKLLDSIKNRYQALNEQRDIRSDNLALNDEQREDLKALTQLHRTARSMQVWPFNRNSLLKFFLAISTPIFVVAVSLLI